MSIEKFKSYLLRETDNQKFFLKHFLNNDQTFGELKAMNQGKSIEVFLA